MSQQLLSDLASAPDGWYWIVPLCGVGVANTALYASCAARDAATGKRADRWSRVLAGIYVFVCFYRSVFMTDTHARLCFTDTVWNAAIVNRTLAAVAEISFGVLGVVTLRDVGLALVQADPRDTPLLTVTQLYLAYALVPLASFLCVASNICSHYGTLTRWSAPLIAEECGWFLYACACALGAGLVLLCMPCCVSRHSGGGSGVKPQYITARRILIALFVGAVAFAAYLAVEDVPMYIAQYQRESALGSEHRTFSLFEGLADSFKCYRVSQHFSDWRGVWLWQTLYFTFGPAAVSLQLWVNRLMRVMLDIRDDDDDDDDDAGTRKRQ